MNLCLPLEEEIPPREPIVEVTYMFVDIMEIKFEESRIK